MFQSQLTVPHHDTALGSFQVAMSSASPPLGEDQVIPFDHVEYNRDGHYNPVQHFYTCPGNGTYVFHASVMQATYSYKSVDAYLYINSRVVVRTLSRNPNDWQIGSFSIVTYCARDDIVTLRVASNEGQGNMYLDGLLYTNFGGFMLNSDFQLPRK